MIQLQQALGSLENFSRYLIGRPLRPYQLEPARAVLQSVRLGEGEAITIEMSRQAGKNELAAQLEAYLLNLYQRRPLNLVKCAPTFKPQVINSKLRLQHCLDNPLNAGRWQAELGYMLRLGQARCIFFSAEPGANVVGATAHLLLAFDEAQDIDPAKHDKDFMPMGATTNVTRVYYGTAWDEDGLLERQKQLNLERQRADGRQRHFRYPWWVVAEHNPRYGRYVEAEQARLGESHPLFRSQYRLETISGQGRLFSAQQRALLRGEHARRHGPDPSTQYVAGVDIAGEDEAGSGLDAALRARRPRKDSTVVTIAAVNTEPLAEGVTLRRLQVVEHLWWTGRKHAQQIGGLIDLFRNVWRPSRVCVDATGVGAGVASLLREALGERVVEQFQFTAPSKSALGYGLLAAVNSGGLKLYQEPEQSEEAAECWRQLELARYSIRAQQQLNFYVDERDGHDDFLLSAALCVRAAEGIVTSVAPAAAVVAARRDYEDGRY